MYFLAQVSFCEGPPPVAWLRSRLTAILAENPWLSGHLRRDHRGAVSLCFDGSFRATGELQLLGAVVNISSSMPYEVLSRRISGSCAEVRPESPGMMTRGCGDAGPWGSTKLRPTDFESFTNRNWGKWRDTADLDGY